MWILSEIVELFFRAFGEAEVEVLGGFVFVIDDPILGWPIVAITKAAVGIFVGLRVASRPAVGPEVSDVEKLTSPDRAGGIAEVAGADVGMTFAFDENRVACAWFFGAGEKPKKAAASHLGQRFELRGFEEGGRKVHEIDEIVADLAGFDSSGPPNRQRLACSAVVEICFAAWERPTIVASHHDDGIVQLACLR